ncbi:rhomboid family intramembrane serine protease [Cellulophaga sp. HaHa_2_95]|uniref:rhomboid family intramembrane serine protease n=1 Tax=Cellulophaga sp. HaHa_2_95 TaxID=2745558 RepID=UPI001C4F08C7|nr:rhomboid family intramembrane serine protease [Cellulophaga sp. HaHa_2_95]QXP55465.1 rhomboid family intramembrane serine protease [Cellulophaga sp. HaHa_2_95]
MVRITEAVKHLIIINVLFFVATLVVGDQMYQWFALWFPKNENFQVWQLITHMFMHGGPSHILFNMFGLWMFGSAVEDYLGKKQFLFLYFSAGLGAVIFQLGFYYFSYLPAYTDLISSGLSGDQIVQMLSSNQLLESVNDGQRLKLQEMFPIYNASMVGASGCIMGVLAAFGVMKPNAELMMIFIPIPIKAKYFIPGIILLDLFSALSGKSYFSPSNTAFMAHVGGAIFGFIMMWYWKKNSFNKNRWD